MLQYLAKRLGRSIISLFIIISVVFILLRQMSIEGYFPNYEKMTDLQIQNGLEAMGLNDPIIEQLGRFWVNLLHGDLGTSITYRNNADVVSIIAEKIPFSIKLGSMAILVSLALGIPLGAMMARYKGKFFDKMGTLFIVFIQAVPSAVYFLFIQLYGTTILDIPLLFDPDNAKSWILPVFSMSVIISTVPSGKRSVLRSAVPTTSPFSVMFTIPLVNASPVVASVTLTFTVILPAVVFVTCAVRFVSR